MPSYLFWNRRPDNLLRSNDPLGFDALRESMADTLVPLLTGGTSSAEEYLYTLIGLRWAREVTRSSLDAELYEHGFKIFERAAKQYWWYHLERSSAGIDVVKELCKRERPNVTQPILANQRTAGLLGTYIVSLRGIGLVHKASLRLVEDKAGDVLQHVQFNPGRRWTSSWDGLVAAFSTLDLHAAKQALGKYLFGDANCAMNCAAQSVRRATPKAADWHGVHAQCLTGDQRPIAAATQCVAALEKEALSAFSSLLRGEHTLPKRVQQSLRRRANEVARKNPYPPAWNERNPLRQALSSAIIALQSGDDAVQTLLHLHQQVTQNVRGNTPWISHIGETSPFAKRIFSASGRDFRFGNLSRLVGETMWGKQ